MASPQAAPQRKGGLQLETELRDAVRGMNRTRPIGHKQGWRRKDALRGDLPLGTSTRALVDDAIDAGAALDDVLPIAHRIEAYIVARVADRDGLPGELLGAYEMEQARQGMTDGAQLQAVARRDETALRNALDLLFSHRTALNAAILATTIELQRVLQ